MPSAQPASSGHIPSARRSRSSTNAVLKCRRKFLRHFPGGFDDETYLDWERNYKWEAHERWDAQLGHEELRALLRAGEHVEIARRAASIESRTTCSSRSRRWRCATR
jgi:hypothetical protein